MTPTLIKSFIAATDIEPHRILTFADPANANTVDEAGANTDNNFAVSDSLGAAAGGTCDAHMGGTSKVVLGGGIQAGQPITAGAAGVGVAAAGAVGTTVRFVGFALEPGVAGDIIDFFIAPGVIHQA